MADTKRGDFPEKICSDCGVKGCYFIHNGELVPAGSIGYFCSECWMARLTDFEETGIAKPLGTIWRLVPEEFAGRELMVKTKSGAVYVLGKPLKETNYLVTSLQKQLGPCRPVQKQGTKLPFDYAAIILLRINKSMLLHYFADRELEKLVKDRDFKKLDPNENIWVRAGVYHTTPVASISYSGDGITVSLTKPPGLEKAIEELS